MKFIANNYTPQEIIKIIREWTGLTQEEFGKKINRSQKGIQAFELGTRNCDLETLLKIADTYNLKITIEKEDRH